MTPAHKKLDAATVAKRKANLRGAFGFLGKLAFGSDAEAKAAVKAAAEDIDATVHKKLNAGGETTPAPASRPARPRPPVAVPKRLMPGSNRR